MDSAEAERSLKSPRRLQRSRKKGARLPSGTICVTRGTKWGNPFVVGVHVATKEEAAREFERALLAGELAFTVADVRRELAGKNLACWCKPGEACHADVLLRIANGK
jgi:hypothetical protein